MRLKANLHKFVKAFAESAPLTSLAQSYIESEGMARNAAFTSLSLVPHWRPVPSPGAFFMGETIFGVKRFWGKPWQTT